MDPDTYKPVEVAAAREIARTFAKDIVAIVAWDRRFNRVHATTYGKSPDDKVGAAKLGEILVKAAGVEPASGTKYEDFRDRSAAEWAAEREQLFDAIDQAIHGLTRWDACQSEITEIQERLVAIAATRARRTES